MVYMLASLVICADVLTGALVIRLHDELNPLVLADPAGAILLRLGLLALLVTLLTFAPRRWPRSWWRPVTLGGYGLLAVVGLLGLASNLLVLG